MTLSATEFELLLQANRIISSKLDIDEVLQAVMELATKVVKADASSLLLLDEKTDELYFDVAVGSASDSVKQIRLKVGEGIAGWVAKERKPLIVNDVTKDPRFTQRVDKSTSFKTKSILAVPLHAKGRLIGVVEAINKEMGGDFTDQDREAFGIFASQSGIAIENARLFSEITREKEKLNTIFGEMSEGVLLLDASGAVVLANASAARFLNIKPADAVGLRFGPGLFNGFVSNPPTPSVDSIKQKLSLFELERPSGKDLTLSLLLLRLGTDASKSAEGFLCILRDITDEKKGGRLKANFLSLVSHKLKTPLTVILGYAPVLASKMENMTEFQKKAISAIAEQSEQLSGLVDKLLHFTIVESEKLNRNVELKGLPEMIDEALKHLDSLVKEKKVNVRIEPSIKSAALVLVDAPLMIDAFTNIIENGIKFNDKNDKRLKILALAEDGRVRVCIVDNGTGIPSEEKEKVFQKFYQIENSFTGQVPGAGLGLALSKKVVESFGGKIEIESELGKGTTVTVTLPTKKSKKGAA